MRNDCKKIFAVSDVHGHCTALKEALDAAGFDKNDPNHLLVSCGDYFDRGNENVQVLQFFERLKHKVLLRGNHEDMFKKLLHTRRVLDHHYLNGTVQTLCDFFGKYAVSPDGTVDFSGRTRTVDRLFDFISETVDYFETENYVFVHGWFPDTRGDWRRAGDEAWERARWVKWTERYDGSRPLSDKTLVCGHMPTLYASSYGIGKKGDSGIFYGNGLTAIDAGTYESKRVNVLVLEDRLI